jgi:hypothetical protein
VISEETRPATSAQAVESPVEALARALKTIEAGRVLVYVKCPVTGAHHCLGHLKRVRGPFHAVPLTILYKRSLGRGKGFGTIAESSLVPTGVYLKVRELLKRYVGFATGVKTFGGSGTKCYACGAMASPRLEKVRFRDGRARFHLSFSCTKCGFVNRPWKRHYLRRFGWLVRRARTVKVARAGGLRCRRCGERAVRAREREGNWPLGLSPEEEEYTRFVLKCARCGFTVAPPEFRESEVAGEVMEIEGAKA